MAERYYWLKLHDDFFDSLRIKKLRKMAGGDTYTIIYLKMQLIAMNKDGIISFKGYEDDICDELALELNEDPENVKVTLAYLLSCGLCETSDSISYYFPYAIENTGSEGKDAARMRIARNKAKALIKPETTDLDEQCANNVRTMSEQCSIEKDKEIDKDIKERNIKKESEKHKYGEYNNVLLTDEEYEKLNEEFSDLPDRIQKLSEYIASKGEKYKSHYATIKNWARMDKERNAARPQTQRPQTPKPQEKPASRSNVDFANASWERLRAEMGLDDADEDNN